MKLIRCLLVGLGFIVLTAIYCHRAHQCVVTVEYVQDPNYVQNVGEAQERLREQGFYDGDIDYKWGPETERAYCNWCASQHFTTP